MGRGGGAFPFTVSQGHLKGSWPDTLNQLTLNLYNLAKASRCQSISGWV